MSTSHFVRRAIAASLPLLLIAGCGNAKPPVAETAKAGSTEMPPAVAPEPVQIDASVVAKAPTGPATNDEIMELAGATVLHWAVVGDYAGENLILNVSTSGYAPVTDHVEIGFDYTMEGNGGLTGTPTFTDFPSTLGALRNGADGCRAPTVSGPYEHSTIERIENGLGGQLYLTVRTDYPAGEVPVACTGGNQASPAHSETGQVEFIVPGIALLMMGDQLTGDDLRVAPDKRSLIVKRDGWTYTYTPTKVR